MLHDLLIAIRTFAKRPGYALSVVGTLAIGISASVMMFSLVDAALLRPLPFEQPDRLVSVWGVAGPQRSLRGGSFPEIADWRVRNATLEGLATYDEMSLNLRVDTEALRVDAELVSPEYFGLLGVPATLGRTFRPEEDAVVGRDHVAVISDRLWRTQFGGDPAVLERTVHLNDRPVQIVGVMPAGFAGASFDTDVWIPSMLISLTSAPSIVTNRGSRFLLAIGRLKPDVTLARAQEDLTRVALQLEQEYPDTNRQRGVLVRSLHDELLGGTGGLILSLFGAVLLVLTVACTNVASLQLARATSRRRELAVRLALGARRWHVLRQLLAESFVLSLLAAYIGALVAAWGMPVVVTLLGDVLPRHVRPAVDPRALAFTIGTSLIVAVLVAILPTLVAWRRDLADALKAGARSAEPGLGSIRHPSAQQALVVGEIALAMLLLTSAGLMVRSLQRQIDVPLGFEARGATIGRLTLPTARYPADQRIVFVERLDERLRRIPGISAVGIGSDMPMTGVTSASTMLPDSAPTTDATIRYYRHSITPGYFAALGMPIVRGRAFTAQDRREAPAVAIINETAARRIWGDADPIGRRIYMGTSQTAPTTEIVGVVADVRFRDLTTDLAAARLEPDIYFPFAQRTDESLEMIVRTADGRVASAGALQAAISELDAGLPLFALQSLDSAVRRQTSSARFASLLLTLFSAVALLLAALGLYGLVAYITSLSRREIAVRVALGASALRVSAVIIRNSMTLVIVGLVLGAIGSFAASRALEAQLFQTSRADPATFGTVAAMLLLVTFAASLVPTRRALKVDPQTALRD